MEPGISCSCLTAPGIEDMEKGEIWKTLSHKWYQVDMEMATAFTTSFYNKIPSGALLLVFDQPMTPDDIKTAGSDKHLIEDFVGLRLRIGIDPVNEIIYNGLIVKHLRF
jgi:AMP nucleosidase